MSNKFISINNLNLKIAGKKILDDVNFSLDKNDWLMIVGPNGSGKSSIVNCIARKYKYNGTIELSGANILCFKNKEFAKNISFMFQQNTVDDSYLVSEILEMGRYCYKQSLFSSLRNIDKQIIEKVKNVCDLNEILDSKLSTLSGGQIQRVILALVLVQDSRVLVLDEPLNNLDLKYQEQCLDILKKWKNEHEITIISCIHDLSLAKKFGNKFLLLKDGCQVSFGDVKNALSNNNLSKTFDMDIVAYMKDINSLW